MTQVLLLMGPSGCGKSFIARLLRDALGAESCRILAFAEPVKRIAQLMLGVEEGVLFGDAHAKNTTKVYGKTVRHFLQWLGTEVARDQVHPDIWVHRAIDAVMALTSATAIFEDLRFPNEAAGFRAWAAEQPEQRRAVVVRIVPAGRQGEQAVLGTAHRSESSAADIEEDFLVINEGGGRRSLRVQLAQVLQALRRPPYDWRLPDAVPHGLAQADD